MDKEQNALQLAERGKYDEARQLFREVLESKIEPLNRAQVLRNIMISYIKEGDKETAIEVGEEILDEPGLCDTAEGVFFHGQTLGTIRELRGIPRWVALCSPFGLLTIGTILIVFIKGCSNSK